MSMISVEEYVNGFNTKLNQCIENGLACLGIGAKRSFYYQIKVGHGSTSGNILASPDDLIQYLEEIAGPIGSQEVQSLIVRQIKISFGLELKCGTSLSEAIVAARRKYLSS